MKRSQSALFVLFITIILVSCKSPEYFIYSPSPPVNPFFKAKGDSKISAYISAASGTQEKEPGMDLQAAYALTNHIAITGSYFYRKERDEYNNWTLFRSPDPYDSVVNVYQRRMGEVGAGYFTTINSRRSTTFNIYGGFGWGNFLLKENGLDDVGNPYMRTHRSDVRKLYIQPSMNFMPLSAFKVGVATRFSFVNYDHIVTTFSETELEDRTLNQFPGRTYLFIEPTVNFQIAFPPPWLKLDLDVTFCPTYDDTYESNHLRHRFISASMGLTFDLSKIRSNKK